MENVTHENVQSSREQEARIEEKAIIDYCSKIQVTFWIQVVVF